MGELPSVRTMSQELLNSIRRGGINSGDIGYWNKIYNGLMACEFNNGLLIERCDNCPDVDNCSAVKLVRNYYKNIITKGRKG